MVEFFIARTTNTALRVTGPCQRRRMLMATDSLVSKPHHTSPGSQTQLGTRWGVSNTSDDQSWLLLVTPEGGLIGSRTPDDPTESRRPSTRQKNGHSS